jgi:hypothetical protein
MLLLLNILNCKKELFFTPKFKIPELLGKIRELAQIESHICTKPVIYLHFFASQNPALSVIIVTLRLTVPIPPPDDPQLDLIPFVGSDLIHFERNLLRIGFFASHEDRKGKSRNIRRIEQSMNVDGQRMTVAIEFRSPRSLPSSSDRDKFMAFLKIAAEQRARIGRLVNPIRFTGYRILQELGITDSGANYEEVNAWGQRMADTTITSEKVVFFAASRRYANKTIHVFESFQRVGNATDKKTAEVYEVVLADWLLDNLNVNYVIPEDFAVYKQLKRPTARGIYGPLHMWFKASNGRAVERDYKQLCAFLGIQSYAYLSKIKSTVGKALDELVAVRYLSRWDIQKMVTAEGYKIVMWPGSDILRCLNTNSPGLAAGTLNQKPTLEGKSKNNKVPEFSIESQEALMALLSLGVLSNTANTLIKKYEPDYILDLAEYASHLAKADKNGRIGNPAGLLIYWLRNDMPVPATFETSRRRRAAEAAKRQRTAEEQNRQALEAAYTDWKDKEVEKELAERYPEKKLEKKIQEIVDLRRKSDHYFARVRREQHPILARQILQKEIREQMTLPSFEQWIKSNAQGNLFSE